MSTLPTAEQNILKLISRQVQMAVSGAYRYREAEITITCGEPFKTTMKMLLDAGWKKQYAHLSLDAEIADDAVDPVCFEEDVMSQPRQRRLVSYPPSGVRGKCDGHLESVLKRVAAPGIVSVMLSKKPEWHPQSQIPCAGSFLLPAHSCDFDA